MHINKSKSFVAGLLIGAITATTVTAIAATELVSVTVDNGIRMIIGGDMKTLPAEYDMLIHKGYTYVPNRYIVEEMGGTINWDAETRTMTITKPAAEVVEKIVEVPVEVEKIVYVDSGPTSTSNIRTLPASLTVDSNIVTINDIYVLGLSSDFQSANDTTNVLIRVQNKLSDSNIVVNYHGATLTANGVTYKTTDVPSFLWNQRLSGLSGESVDIAPNSETSGQLVFPKLNQATTEFQIMIPVRKQSTGEESIFEFRVYKDLS